MKTDAELDAIAQAIRDSCQLTDPDYPRTRRKLLRSIELDGLREAYALLNDTQTDTPISDLHCLIRERAKELENKP